jgi:hypothetical protein
MGVVPSQQEVGAALLARLDAIAGSLARRDHARSLIGVGSVGTEVDRLDEFSDLDFFAIVDPGHQREFIDDISWLRDVAPIAFSFQNTRDGHKVLFEDGIYAEFAVFGLDQLAHIAAPGARVVWRADDVGESDLAFAEPTAQERPSVEFLVGEITTNLYVGLQRYRRGEKLSAMRFIQNYAIDSFIKLLGITEDPGSAHKDTFDLSRRVEQRYPAFAACLPSMAQGVERSPASALAILAALKERVDVDPAIERRILEEARCIAGTDT